MFYEHNFWFNNFLNSLQVSQELRNVNLYIIPTLMVRTGHSTNVQIPIMRS